MQNTEPITVVWVFKARKAHQFTLEQIASLVDGLTPKKLRDIFLDYHVEGEKFAGWFARQNPPPCTLKADFAALVRARLTAQGLTTAAVKDPEIFMLRAMEAYWNTPRLAEAAQAAEEQGRPRRYLELLLRRDAPQAGDEDELACLMQALKVTPARLEKDLNVIREARRLTALHAEWARLNEAGEDLKRLAKTRPDFFDTGIVPRLLGG